MLALLGLGAGWYLTGKHAAEEQTRSVSRILTLSNEVVNATFKLTEQQKVNASLETNLASRLVELGSLSNRWTQATGELSQQQEEAKAAAEAARREIERRDKQITDLEGEREDLTQRMEGLTDEIKGLNQKITDTERKLSASEGDRAQLQRELKRLLAEKADLEQRFNNLAVLREQVRKLKEEIAVAKRIDYLRRGVYGTDKKGAQVLRDGFRAPAKPGSGTNAPIQAEVGTDGSVKVVAPGKATDKP